MAVVRMREDLFDRGHCPVCVIYDLKGHRNRADPWRWCRCCGVAWRRLPDGSLVYEQVTMLVEPCKHQKKLIATTVGDALNRTGGK
jgi:hypothetical protein